MKKSRRIALVAVILLLGSSIACTKKVAVAPPPPPPKVEVPEAPKPNPPTIVTFAVEPTAIERGQSANLRWNVTNATRVEIDHGIGAVAASGERRVAPEDPTIFRLLASGPGGEASAIAALEVNLPPPPPPPPVAPPPTISERLANEVHDVYFDFDRSNIRTDANDTLTDNAVALKSIMADFPTTTVILEGHCDERGSAEYNLGLGDRRAAAVKSFLSGLGLHTDRLLVISYGKERPQCTESNEECWQKNRRVHFAPGEDQIKRVLHGAE